MMLFICGASAYARDWDYARFRAIADKVGALLLADRTIAHFVDGAKDVLRLADGTIVDGAAAAALIESATHVHGANLTVNEYGHPLFGDFFSSDDVHWTKAVENTSQYSM